jgi:hypothetical protein
MTVTVKQVRDALSHHADSVGKNKVGAIVIRKGFFYRNGWSVEKFTDFVDFKLREAGLSFKIVRDGEHYAPFRGSATVAQSSHWYVELV